MKQISTAIKWRGFQKGTSVKILMLAPQPFLEERGAPFAIYHHIKVLVSMDIEVDLITYHLGKQVELPGLRILRIPDLPFIQQVKVGPSLTKILLDMLIFFTALRCLLFKRYDAIHTHEEAGLIGVFFSAVFGCKHLYYMHSDLSQQIVSSEFTQNRFIIRIVQTLQAFIIRHSHAVIAICPDIEVSARRMAGKTPIYMIENSAVDENLPLPDADKIAQLGATLQVGQGPILLYTGTLESYQGIDILLQSIPIVRTVLPHVCYVIVGGQPEQVEKLRLLAAKLQITDAVRFVGKQPLEKMPMYMALADILLSPRTKGTNTPLKLYTYLHAGKPILATNIFSQTQVLSPDTAMLVPPTIEGLAQGTLHLLQHPQMATEMGLHAQRFAEEHYSWKVFLTKSTQVQCDFTRQISPSLV